MGASTTTERFVGGVAAYLPGTAAARSINALTRAEPMRWNRTRIPQRTDDSVVATLVGKKSHRRRFAGNFGPVEADVSADDEADAYLLRSNMAGRG